MEEKSLEIRTEELLRIFKQLEPGSNKYCNKCTHPQTRKIVRLDYDPQEETFYVRFDCGHTYEMIRREE